MSDTLNRPDGFKPIAFVDENGVSYGVKQTDNVPHVKIDGQASGSEPIEVEIPPCICTENSTSTPLLADATFTGVAVLTNGYGIIYLNVFSDVESATDGLVVEQSTDGTNWDFNDTYSVPANTGKTYSIQPAGRYIRVKYTNGGTDQTVFRLQTVMKHTGLDSSHRVQDTLNDDDDGRLRLAVLKLRTAQNTYVSGSATANGNFKTALEEYDETFLTNPFPTQLRDSSGTEIGGKLFDERTSTYKGLLFNEGSPQICSQDYLLALSEGDISGHTAFSKFGRVSGVTNTIVDLWYNGTATPSVYVFPTTAIQFNVVSTSANDTSAGTGIRTLRLVGLDTNYAEISEDITMNGTTPVTTTSSFLRINACYALTAGTTGAAEGIITIKDTAGTVTYSAIAVGLNACRQLIYTVPANKTLYLTSLTVASGDGGNSLKLNAITHTPKVRAFGSSIFLPSGELLTLNAETVRRLEIPGVFPAKSDIKMSVYGDYASAATVCIGAVRGWLE